MPNKNSPPNMRRSTIQQWWRETLPASIIKYGFAPMGHLPLWILRITITPFSWCLSWIAPNINATWRDILNQNFPHRASKIVHQSIRHLGMTAFEYAWLWQNPNINASLLPRYFPIVQGEAMVDTTLGHAPVLILGGHFGQWEVVPVALTLRGAQEGDASPRYSGNGLYRSGRRDWIEALLRWRNNKPPFMAFPAGRQGVGEVIKRLLQKQFTYILVDQVPPEGAGDWVDFFGQPVYTMRLAAKLSTLPSVQTWFAYTLRTNQGFAIYVDDLTPALTLCGDDRLARTQVINAHLEQRVREHPDMYVWHYSRFRQPKGRVDPSN